MGAGVARGPGKRPHLPRGMNQEVTETVLQVRRRGAGLGWTWGNGEKCSDSEHLLKGGPTGLDTVQTTGHQGTAVLEVSWFGPEQVG